MSLKLFNIRLLACIIFFSSSTYAEITVSNLIAKARSVSESQNYDNDYEFVKSNYTLANGPQLFYAAVVEANLGNQLESVKYLIAGQTRSVADMTLFKPANESDEKLIADLYGMIFYQFGGAGGNEIYKDENKYSEVLKYIQSYKPIINKSYNPGWNYSEVPDSLEYRNQIDKGKEHRINQLTNLVGLLQNDEYLALSKELDELNDTSENSERRLEILNKMRGISGVSKIEIPK